MDEYKKMLKDLELNNRISQWKIQFLEEKLELTSAKYFLEYLRLSEVEEKKLRKELELL